MAALVEVIHQLSERRIIYWRIVILNLTGGINYIYV